MSARILLVFAILAIIVVIVFVGRNLYLRSLRLRRRLQMSDIFTNITHELLTPLTVISASVDKLREEAPQHGHDYDLMQLNIQRMVRLLQQILETSKSEAGQLKLVVAQGDVMRYIRETAECLEPLLVRKRQQFSISCYPESMMGWIDTDKLDKIIYNLLSNAAKYSKENGVVLLKVQTNNTFDHIHIEVSDTGDGIPPEKMRHLFQRFHDGEYRKHQTIGTGLGLNLTHDLVFLHHGTIHCQSEVGKGTTFTVELPINKEAFKIDEIDETRTIDFNIPKNAIIDVQACAGAQFVVYGRRAGTHISSEGFAVVGVVVKMSMDTSYGTAEELLIRRLGGGNNTMCLVGSLLMVFFLDAFAVLNDVVDAEFEITETEGLGEVFVSTEKQGLLLVFLLRLGSEQDDGQMVVVGVALDGLCEFVAVHLRHHHIGDDEVEVFLVDDVKGLKAVLCGVDVIR